MQEEDSENRLIRDALLRVTHLKGVVVDLTHKPINATQCDQLQKQLRQLVRQKVDRARRQYQTGDYSDRYSQVYNEFMMMTGVNESTRQKMCKDISQMHEMADILLNPPSFSELCLCKKQKQSIEQRQQFDELLVQYQRKYKVGNLGEQDDIQQVIKKAKEFYLRDRS